MCIDPSRRCDNQADCSDSSDEAECDANGMDGKDPDYDQSGGDYRYFVIYKSFEKSLYILHLTRKLCKYFYE